MLTTTVFSIISRLTPRNQSVTDISNQMVTRSRRQSEAVFRAIADPTRRQILGLLRGGGRTVGEVAGNFRVSRPAISKHLRLLRSAGLVRTRRRGAARICELNAGPLKTVNDWLRDYEAFWQDNLQNLKRFVEENP
jgi:DNA-binding transcriptional ArsR family regulator